MEILTSASGILDLAIIGAGPAGTAAALEARRHGLSAVIWERDRFPRDKVCGEFISSEALPLLQNAIPETMARGAAIHCAKFVSGRGLTRTFRLPRPARGLSRRLLDAALWKAAEASGAEGCECETVRRVQKLDSGGKHHDAWEIESVTGSVRRAKALILRGCPRRPDRWDLKSRVSGLGPRPTLPAFNHATVLKCISFAEAIVVWRRWRMASATFAAWCGANGCVNPAREDWKILHRGWCKSPTFLRSKCVCAVRSRFRRW